MGTRGARPSYIAALASERLFAIFGTVCHLKFVFKST
jgi:hypothetical protein